MRIASLRGMATRYFTLPFAVLAGLVLCIGVAGAQTSAVVGTVRDAETGKPIAGATVLLTGTPLSAIASADGRFAIEGLQGGRYTLRAVAIGFSADGLFHIELAAGERRDLTLRLERIPLMLQEVVVTASRVVERSEESAVSVAALPSHEVVRRNVTTIDKALVYVPGVTFNGSEQLDIRGAAGFARGVGSRVLMLLDGHPILSGDGGEIDFASIPLLDLDRAEIVKGAYSAIYGSSAVGGVVNMVTNPVGMGPETVFRAHAEAYTFKPEYKWAGETQEAFGFGVQHSRRIGSIGGRFFLGYESTDGFTENGESDRWLGRVKVASGPTSSHPWDAYAVFTRDRSGEFFTWRSADEPYRVSPNEVGDHTVDNKLLTGATITPLARTTTLVRLSPYFNVNTLQNRFSDNSDWHRAVKPGMLAQLSWYPSQGHAVTLGTDGAYTWVNSNFLGNPRILDLAVFAQDEFPVTRNLKGSVGVRLDHHKSDVGESEWAVSPKAGVALRVAPRATLRMSVGGGYRAPSAIEQFVSTQQFGFRVVPNPALRGEQAWSGEIGTTVTVVNRVRIDGALFGSVYHDLIGPAPAPGQPFVFQFQNVSRARVAGVDLGINAQVIPDRLELQATYLFLDTEDRDANKPLPYRSRHNVTGTINVFGGLAGLDTRYRSRVEEVLGYPVDPRSDVIVLDLRVGYRAVGVLWQLKVANLFNRFYVDVQERNPGAPRSIAITALHGI